MFRIATCISLLLLSIAIQAAAAGPLQRDWMVGLVEGLGWSFGLPNEPDDEDYQRILSGGRVYRYEAEALCHPDDMVSVKSYRTYGYCSGDGWLSGISTPTTAHLEILVPIPGTFEVEIRLRKAGHRIQIGEAFFPADAGDMFENVNLGEVTLQAGYHPVTLLLPPDGAVDYLEFTATQLKPVAPAGGWQPDEPLRYSDMALTALQVLSLEGWLIPSGEEYVWQGEDAKLYDGATKTSIRHLGEPDAGAWVRAGNLAGRLSQVLDVPPGVYRLSVRGMGERPLFLSIPGIFEDEVPFKPYLVDEDLGYHYFSDTQRLTIHIPPRSGIDRIELLGYRSSPADFLSLAGLPQNDGEVDSATLDDVLKLLVTLSEPR